MTGCFVDRGICLPAAVALLMAVLSSPIRSAGASEIAPGPLPRNFAILEGWRGIPSAISARPALREASPFLSDLEDELDADVEDEPTVTSPLTSLSFEILASPCPELDPERLSLAVATAPRPLRC